MHSSATSQATRAAWSLAIEISRTGYSPFWWRQAVVYEIYPRSFADATADALRDGWLYTGDMGSFDPDGYLTLRDRSKDLIISGGMNIYPREVEEALLRHPGVQAAAVVGRPDAKWGEAVVAFVVADSAARPSADDLDRTCLDHIARFKRPKDYRFVDALPTNNYGKVVKRELRDRLQAETADGGSR